MSRSIRRHHAARARVRKLRILSYRGCYWYWPQHKDWKPLNRSMMSEPGWWVHEWMTVPARRRSRQLEHLVERGAEDHWRWPDNRKPHKYYW